MKSEIVEHFSRRKNVLVNPTGVNHSSSPLSSWPDTWNNTDKIVLETLEGHILPLLTTVPLSFHNLHLKTSVLPKRYVELDLPIISGNKGEKHAQLIGTSKVDYTLYPNGTVNVEVSCSNRPFRLQTDKDRSRLLVFLGQIRVLISILKDSHERIVPDVLEWELTECDLNKDVIQVKMWQ
jgi:hypothetical protein